MTEDDRRRAPRDRRRAARRVDDEPAVRNPFAVLMEAAQDYAALLAAQVEANPSEETAVLERLNEIRRAFNALWPA